MVEKGIGRREFLGLALSGGLGLLINSCATTITKTEYDKYYEIRVKDFSTDKPSPKKEYPLELRISLLEDLEIYRSENSYHSEEKYREGDYFMSVGGFGVVKTETGKIPQKDRLVRLSQEDESYFLINNRYSWAKVQPDSGGVVKVSLTPNYSSKNKIAINVNDIINEGVVNSILRKATITSAKIMVEGKIIVTRTKEFESDGSKTSLPLDILTIEKYGLEQILSEFLSSGFNSYIKTFTLYLRDIDSRVDLPEVKLKIKGENIPNQPQHNQDFARLFKGDLLKYVESLSIGSQFKDYVKNEEITFVSGDSGKIQIPVYLGAQYSIELIHPKYNFAQEKITFDTRTPNEIPILMSELGTKVRLEILKNK